jgi:hypothetical protein
MIMAETPPPFYAPPSFDSYSDVGGQQSSKAPAIIGLIAAVIALLCFFLPWTVISIVNPGSWFGVGEEQIKITSSGWQLMTLSSPRVSGLGALGQLTSSVYNQINMGQMLYQSTSGGQKTVWTLDRIGLGFLLFLTLIALILALVHLTGQSTGGKPVTIVTGLLGVVLTILTAAMVGASFKTSNNDLDLLLNSFIHFSNGIGFWGAILAYLAIMISGIMSPSPMRTGSDETAFADSYPGSLEQYKYGTDDSPKNLWNEENSQPYQRKSVVPWVVLGAVLLIGLVILVVILTNHPAGSRNNSNNGGSSNGDLMGPLSAVESTTSEMGNISATLIPTQQHVVATAFPGLQAAIDTLYSSARLLSQPESGTIRHNPSDALIHSKKIDDDIENFIVEVDFHNPYAASTAAWDYGFMFRDTGWNNQYRLIIDSSKRWYLKLRNGEDTTIVDSGRLQNLNSGEGESNQITLLCQGGQGFFLLNNIPVAQLDVNAKQESGHLFIAINMQNEETIAGAETAYSDVNVYSLP